MVSHLTGSKCGGQLNMRSDCATADAFITWSHGSWGQVRAMLSQLKECLSPSDGRTAEGHCGVRTATTGNAPTAGRGWSTAGRSCDADADQGPWAVALCTGGVPSVHWARRAVPYCTTKVAWGRNLRTNSRRQRQRDLSFAEECTSMAVPHP
jgi:hypothetical protein